MIQGTAVCDVAIASHALERASAQGVGQTWITSVQQQRPAGKSAELKQEAEFLSDGLRKLGQARAN